MEYSAKTLVLGLGNPILTDDGVGLRVAEELEKRLSRAQADVIGASLAGLDLLETLAGYERVIIVDAMQTGGPPGKVYRLDLNTFQSTRHAASPHDVNLATALELGKKLGLKLPTEIDIFAIEAIDTTGFSERCTPEVAEAIPVCVEMVLNELAGTGTRKKVPVNNLQATLRSIHRDEE
jgi:hydrogenase maturation protease